jgi:O-antigen ligase
VKSFKYLLAKVWYITPFLLGTLLIVRQSGADLALCGFFYAVGACFSVLYVVSRHATKGFSFEEINWALHPFLPQPRHLRHLPGAAGAVYGLRRPGDHQPRPASWRVMLGILLFGLLTSYTRASILSLPVAGAVLPG